ncbi:MAG: recombinase family protein [Candidatus Latescibacteria bacterium]|nr:recombinase family protein [Candidatus Latescibacterota bacterium]
MPPKKRRAAIYARVSTTDQDPRMQLRELRSYVKRRGFDLVDEYVDKESGANGDREALNRLWRVVRAGKVDIVLVWKFDRFARSTKQLVDALEEFHHLGVDFVSLTEQIDTSSPMGKAMFTIISAIAEFERSLISERVKAGIAKARAQGRPHGRPRVGQDTVRQIRTLRGKGMSLRAIAKRLSVSKSTVDNYA